MKNLSLDDKLFGRLKDTAEKRDIYPDQLASAIIRRYLDEQGAPEIDIQPADDEDLIARPAPRHHRSENPAEEE